MATDEFFVSLTVNETVRLIHDAMTCASFTGELLDQHEFVLPTGRCVIQVFERHYMRAGNRLTLTVTVDVYTGTTRVHSVGSGGGAGLFRFDWGASKSFAAAPQEALAAYLVSPPQR